jgi:hypothetical protein
MKRTAYSESSLLTSSESLKKNSRYNHERWISKTTRRKTSLMLKESLVPAEDLGHHALHRESVVLEGLRRRCRERYGVMMNSIEDQRASSNCSRVISVFS